MLHFLLLFLYNWCIAGSILSILLGSWLGHNPYVIKVLLMMHIMPTPDHVIFAMTFVLLLGIAFLNIWPPVTNLTLRLWGAHRPEGELATYLYSIRDELAEYVGKPLDHYDLFIQPSYDLNAFAIGRHHIAINTPMLELPREEILGIMAHELGHIECRHTTYGGMIYAMECVTKFIMILFDIIVVTLTRIVAIFRPLYPFALMFNWIYRFIFWFNWSVIYRIITYISLYVSRRNEYEADAYACRIGLGVELHNGLLHFYSGKTHFFDEFGSTHPGIDKRLRAICAYLEREGNLAYEEEV